MSKRAVYTVTVDGSDITTKLTPIVLSISVSLQDGEQGDTASLLLDDTAGQIAMPETGVAIVIAVGWSGAGQRVVFEGTVDEVKSTGARGAGRTLSISAKGFDPAGKAKEARRRHWDDATVQTIVGDAAADAGIGQAKVDPDLAKITLKYWSMNDESLLHMGQRLARRIGGNFQIQGKIAVMARRGALYSPAIRAAHGDNLHSWDLSPVLARKIYGKVRADYFDRKRGVWDKVEVETGLEGEAVLRLSPPASSKEDADRQAKAKAEASKREAGGGSVTIEGAADAVPGAQLTLAGARPGIDGAYRVLSVGHQLDRSGGFITTIDVGHPDTAAAETKS